jgi:hypothetical protein
MSLAAITIPYRLLADIIGRLDSADVVTLATDGVEVTVTTLSGSYKLSRRRCRGLSRPTGCGGVRSRLRGL